ncbi:hypothetical protein JHK82_024902 [Glycine max]|uniref:Uncharacterized protein n=1 Tax=Glycine max TaxID=3847 RepID=A0A0R0IBC2_SOYBN|nr:hypothetical protein JHK86_025021 [Glycine max]KAG5133714.1 hypothetical protein JHK82_024902 [Glycine max]KRH38290.1 hypothetical protein GLYMA_09G124900v4 [Glycine max]
MAIYVKSKQPPQSNVTTLIMKKVRNLVNDEESASKLPLNFQVTPLLGNSSFRTHIVFWASIFPKFQNCFRLNFSKFS